MPNSASSKSTKYLNLLIAIVFSLVGLFSIVNLIGTNMLATQGVVLDEYASKTDHLIKSSNQLQVDIARSTNLSYIESRAQAKGFHRVNSKVIVEAVDSLALSR